MKAVTTRNRTPQKRLIEFGKWWISIRLPDGPRVSGNRLCHALRITASDR